MILVGTKLYGFCGGWFGRDAYGDKRVEAVGVDWVVARTLADCDDGYRAPLFAEGPDVHTALEPYTKPENREPPE